MLSTVEAKELLRLCKSGRLFEIQNWIDSGNSLCVPTDSRITPLEAALDTGFHSLVELLVSNEPSQELKNRTKKFALDVIGLCAGLPHLPETRHAIDQLIRSSSSVAANYRSACRGKSKADFIAKLGIVEEEADESGFWLEMLRDVCELLSANSEPRTHHPLNRSRTEIRDSKLDLRTSQELARLLDETDQLVAITVASRKTARAT